MVTINRSELLLGKESIEILNNSKVMVIGLGGVGGFACEALARSGVGHLVLVDFDTVEASNMNRQLIATYDTLEHYKTDCFKQRIASINPNCVVDLYTDYFNPNMIDESFDFIVDCMDDVAGKVDCIEKCQQLRIGLITVCGTARKKDPSKLCVSTLEKTEYDPLAKAVRTNARKRRLNLKTKVIYSKEVSVAMQQGQPLPSMIFVPASAGILAASVAVNSIIDKLSES